MNDKSNDMMQTLRLSTQGSSSKIAEEMDRTHLGANESKVPESEAMPLPFLAVPESLSVKSRVLNRVLGISQQPKVPVNIKNESSDENSGELKSDDDTNAE
ncbi:MAG: hypothetical protein LBI69_04205 [Puniceicoccales bacterium]|jgi:hypothetical protein|nr:hypothetical protein [Puniceicoccales bacterium]